MEWVKDTLQVNRCSMETLTSNRFARSSRDRAREDPDPSDVTSSTREVTAQDSHSQNEGAAAENTTAPHLSPDTGLKQTTQNPSADEPLTPGLGTVSIIETLTYKSHVLPPGDTVPSVIDPTSDDPLTFVMPEHTYRSTTGVPSGAAETAASTAFNKDSSREKGIDEDKKIEQEVSHIPGAFPKSEPSTPGVELTQGASTAAREATGHGTVSSLAGGHGLTSTRDSTVRAPSTLTTTTSPADRDVTYGEAEKTKIPNRTANTASTTTRSIDDGSSQPEQRSTMNKILGAVGLGGAAASVSAALPATTKEDEPHPVADTPDQPTTTTGVDSYTAPTRSGPPQSHYRKESIPTTAYPQGESSPTPIDPPVGGTEHPTTTTGVDSHEAPTRSGPSHAHYRKESIPTTAYPQGESSPTPINPPVGGTAVASEETERQDHTSRNAGLGSGTAAAVGAHEYNEHRAQPETSWGQQSGSAVETTEYPESRTPPEVGQGKPGASTPFHSLVTSGGSSAPSQRTSTVGRDIDDRPASTSGFNGPGQSYSQEPDNQSRSYGTAAVAGGAGLAAGAAAVAAHEYNESRAPPEQTSGYTGAPEISQSTAASSSPFASGYQPGGQMQDFDERVTTTSAAPIAHDQNTGGPTAYYEDRARTAAPLAAGDSASYHDQRSTTTTAAPFATGQQTGGLTRELEGRPTGSTTFNDPSKLQSQPSNAAEPDYKSRGYDKAAAAAGIGAGAGAVGAHAFGHNNESDTGALGGGTPYSTTQTGKQDEPYRYNENTARADPISQRGRDERHTGRDVAIAGGAGAGAGAYGAHEYNKYEGEREAARPESRHQHEPLTSTKNSTTSRHSPAGKSTATDPSTQLERDERHTGRDAAVVGATGAGAGAYGAHEYSKREAEQDAARAEARHQLDPVSSPRDTTTNKPTHAATSEKATRTDAATHPEKDERHLGRDAAVVGAAGAGAGAYGAYEYDQHEAEKEAARRQKAIDEQEEARRKQFEKDQKAAEKRAAKEEKAEKHHQKEIEKEEKKHQKELEKEQKHEKQLEKEELKHQKELDKEAKYHHKEFEKEQKEREKAAAAAAVAEKERQQHHEREEREHLEAAETDRKRREKEAAAVGTGAAGTAAYAGHDKEGRYDTSPKTSQDTDRNRLHKDPPQGKKPGILQRIFKRRHNKDTGLEEEYSTDEEEEHHRGGHVTGAGAVGGAGAVAGTAAAHESQQRTGAGAEHEAGQGTGFIKPSYNPLNKEPFAGTAAHDTPIADNLARERQGYEHSGTAGVNEPTSSSSAYPAGTAAGVTGSAAGVTAATGAQHSGLDNRPRDSTTGLPYDPKKDPEAARHLDELEHQHHQHEAHGGGSHRLIDQLKPLPSPDKAAREHEHGYRQY